MSKGKPVEKLSISSFDKVYSIGGFGVLEHPLNHELGVRVDRVLRGVFGDGKAVRGAIGARGAKLVAVRAVWLGQGPTGEAAR